MSTAVYRRYAAAIGLLTSSLLAAISRFLYQPRDGNDPAKLLSNLNASHSAALAASLLFAIGQLAFIAAALGLGHLLRGRFAKLSSIGATLAVVGAFCEAVATSFFLVYNQMAQDVGHRAAYVAVLKQTGKIEGLFSIVGALGTVVGLLLLSIGVFRARIGPRWVAPLLWAFLVLEFVGSSANPSIGLASVTVALIAYWALAFAVRRSPETAWETRDQEVLTDAVTLRVPAAA